MALPSQCLSWAMLSACAGTRRAGTVSEASAVVCGCLYPCRWVGDVMPFSETLGWSLCSMLMQRATQI